MQQTITKNMKAIRIIFTVLLSLNILAPLAFDWGFGISSAMAILIYNPITYTYVLIIVLLFAAWRSTVLAFLFLAPLFTSIFYLILSVIGLNMASAYQTDEAPLFLFLILQLLTLTFNGILMNHDPNKFSEK
jgi:hypothetical protein